MASNVNSIFLSSVTETIRHFISSFFIKKTKYQTSDSTILQLYYKYTVYFILFFEVSVLYNCYYTDPIRCVSSTGGDVNIGQHHLNYCLSYSRNPKLDTPVAFYKWLPWILMALMFYFYLIKKVMKLCHCNNISVAENTGEDEVEGLDKCFYFHLLAHLVALFMNGLSFFPLNFCLQGTFWDLVPASFPFHIRNIVLWRYPETCE